MSTSREKMQEARELIQQKHYDEARAILRTVNHDMALDWLDKIDELDPQFAEPSINSNLPPKSYTNAAVIVLVLYFVMWLPGLIVNHMYLSEANRMEEEYGDLLPGVGALKAESYLLGWLPLILGMGVIVVWVVMGLLK